MLRCAVDGRSGPNLPPVLQKRLGGLRLKARHAAANALGYRSSRGISDATAEFIAGVGGAIAWPLTARAQQALPVIGYLAVATLDSTRETVAAIHRGLSETGYVEGRNFERIGATSAVGLGRAAAAVDRRCGPVPKQSELR